MAPFPVISHFNQQYLSLLSNLCQLPLFGNSIGAESI